MPRTMIWLAAVIRVAIAPVLLGALVLLVNSARSPSDLAVSAGLVLLGAIHVLYWWRPGNDQQGRAAAALAGTVFINFVLLNLLRLPQPPAWLYPPPIPRSSLCIPVTPVGVGLTASPH